MKLAQDCRPNRQKLMKRYLQEIPTRESSYLTLAIDHTTEPRRDSPTLKDRGYHHSPQGETKVTIGHSYSTIAWIPEDKGSWALPLRHERITSFETPISKATWQLKQVVKNLNQPVLVLLDSEYSCLYGEPEPYKGIGRPKKHGAKFKLNIPSTWSETTEIVETNHEGLGLLKIRQWSKLHFRNSPSTKMELILGSVIINL
jgi:hypothetical protein